MVRLVLLSMNLQVGKELASTELMELHTEFIKSFEGFINKNLVNRKRSTNFLNFSSRIFFLFGKWKNY